MEDDIMPDQGCFCPARLKIAREYAGLSQSSLAKEMESCTQAAISRFEEGDLVPSKAQISKMSKVLGWQPDFFYLPAEIMALPATTHFRKKNTTPAPIVAKVHAQVNLTIALLRLVGYSPVKEYDLDPIMKSKLSPEEAAGLTFKIWKVDESVPFDLVDKIEKSGILIVEMPLGGVDAGEIDGLSILTPDLGAVIFINRKSSADRLRFTIAHELGHILMHHLEPRINMEDEANAYGGNLILPEKMLDKALASIPLSFATLPLLKKTLKVSMAAILVRTKQLRRLSDSAYTAAWREFNRLGWKQAEPYSIEREIPSRFRSLLTGAPSVGHVTGMSPNNIEELYEIAV